MNGFAQYSRDESGGDNIQAQVTATWRPASNLNLSFGPVLNKNRSTGQFVRSVGDALPSSTYGRRYVFADLNQTTLYMDTRIEWTFTPLLSLQVYAQPFVSAGRFSEFKEFLTPKTYDFAVYGRDRGDDRARRIRDVHRRSGCRGRSAGVRVRGSELQCEESARERGAQVGVSSGLGAVRGVAAAEERVRANRGL
ncbi:MAG: hypothetical protein M3O61_09865 [Gemmatimonadota bacterium]|nr:hypothetical protein [Gemmatimonadota bacterium]